MFIFSVSLSSVDDIKAFCDAAATYPSDVDVRAGRYLINAKSIMGLFSLDMSKPVQVELQGSQEDCDAFKASIARFVIESAE